MDVRPCAIFWNTRKINVGVRVWTWMRFSCSCTNSIILSTPVSAVHSREGGRKERAVTARGPTASERSGGTQGCMGGRMGGRSRYGQC